MKNKLLILTLLVSAFVAAVSACGINSVTKEELAKVKVGNVLVYRFQKNGKSWFVADKVTRIEGDKIYFVMGKMEADKGSDARIRDFGTDEDSITKDELLKFSEEQGENQKKIIWIE